MPIEIFLGSRRLLLRRGDADAQTIQHLKEAMVARGLIGPRDSYLVDWFYVRSAYLGMSPVSVEFYDGSAIDGVVLLYERLIFGIKTGAYISPYSCGFCSYLGNEDNRIKDINDAASVLFDRHFTLSLAADVSIGREQPCLSAEFAIRKARHSERITDRSSYFPLDTSLEATLARFSRKTRRNIRYHRGRALREKQYRFIDDLSEQASVEAVKSLNPRSLRSLSPSRALYRCLSTHRVPGAYAAGIMDRDGNWLSYAAGWRVDNVTYLDWQINREESSQFSFSLVMRSHLIESEIQRRTQAIYLLGGSTRTWESACDKHQVYSLNALRTGLVVSLCRRPALILRDMRPIHRLRKLASAISRG